MKPIADRDRRVANIHKDVFEPFIAKDGTPDGEVLQVNPGNKRGYGFHLYRMGPGDVTVPHRHNGDEEFFLIDGDLADHDGYQYETGDIVWLRNGTEHNSSSKNGCVLVVYLPGDAQVSE